MSWAIHEITNETTPVSAECETDLNEFFSDEDMCLVQSGKLYFDPDHMEHMDWLADKEVQEILVKHNVTGFIGFGDLEGDNAGSFWGYRLEQGQCREVSGTITWEA
jgi:hypothetical protein